MVFAWHLSLHSEFFAALEDMSVLYPMQANLTLDDVETDEGDLRRACRGSELFLIRPDGGSSTHLFSKKPTKVRQSNTP